MKEYIYEGEWNDPNDFYYYNDVEVKKNIMVTDLGVTAKMGRNDRIDVFAFSISNASPQSGVSVKAYNYQKQEIASGKTDFKERSEEPRLNSSHARISYAVFC